MLFGIVIVRRAVTTVGSQTVNEDGRVTDPENAATGGRDRR